MITRTCDKCRETIESNVNYAELRAMPPDPAQPKDALMGLLSSLMGPAEHGPLQVWHFHIKCIAVAEEKKEGGQSE